ncbi:hypothetical protein QYM36_012469 [Artemia franciscana]|uniref:RNase H type-1 domain-containing protein n=1 Tax=Artemia franciscana TaxID=6661 RepID=A0AA88HHA1_ARTSF|nr:hypothetical protein QYM36_012469 [Artemia franciscana]
MQIWHDPTNGSNQFQFAGSPQSVTYQTITSPGQSQAIRYYNQTDTNQWINTKKENKTVKVKNKRETIKEHIQLSVQNRFEALSDEAANESDNESYMGEAVSCREAEGMPSISNDINNERRREEDPRILTPTVTNTLAIPKGHEKVNLENKAKSRKPFPMTVITNASIEYNCSVNIILTDHNKQFPNQSTIIKNLKNILKENKFEYDLVKNNELFIVHSQNENSKELLLKTTKLGSLSVMVELRKNPLNYIKFNHLMVTEYKEHLKVYTDGSKNNEVVGAAFVIPILNKTEPFKLDPSQSIFEAELVAIMKAGSYLMSISSEKNKILICSDSKSAIEELQSPKQTSREITTTQLVMDKLATSTNTSVTIMWVPGHKNIRGNEEADIAAKKAIVAGLPINGTTPKIIGTIENMIKKIKIERLSEWRDKNGTCATVLLGDIEDDKLAVKAVKLMTKFLKKIGRATAV